MDNTNFPFLGTSGPEHLEPRNKSNVSQITPPQTGHTMSETSTHNPKRLYWLTAKFYSFCFFLISALPMFALSVFHECSSIGYFIYPSLNCGGTIQFSPISPGWSHLVLVLYYYCLSKYCTMIEN